MPTELLPPVILLDEPTLDLDPAAISLIGDLIQSLSVTKQIIVATKSPMLVGRFSLNQIIVCNLKAGQTTASRPNTAELKHWLSEYSTSQL